MKSLKYSLFFFAIVAALSSCKKEEEDDNDQPGAQATGNSAKIHPMHMWGMDAFELNTNYAWGSGNVRFQEIRFYLSDFHFHGDASDEHAMFMDQAWLLDASDEGMQHIGTIGFDHIHEWDFLLGLNEDLNHAVDPANAPAPLNDGSMHWGWNPDSGYKFIKIEGEQDADGDGTFEIFSIHAATDNLKREINLSVEQSAVDDEFMFHIMIDYQAMFEGVDFGNLSGTHGDSELTNGIADNLAGAISLQ